MDAIVKYWFRLASYLPLSMIDHAIRHSYPGGDVVIRMESITAVVAAGISHRVRGRLRDHEPESISDRRWGTDE